MSYANRTRQPPRTLSDDEQKRLLKVSGEHRDGFRDHVIFSLALGCGLRESEILGLDVGDVSTDGVRKIRRTIQLRVFKRAGTETANPADQRVHLPDGCFYKLGKYLAHERRRRGIKALAPEAPLFLAREGRRLSDRRLREIFHEWQAKAGFDYRYNFHALRHTAITAVARKGGIRLAQRVARHTNIATTAIYDHPSDQELLNAVKGLRS